MQNIVAATKTLSSGEEFDTWIDQTTLPTPACIFTILYHQRLLKEVLTDHII